MAAPLHHPGRWTRPDRRREAGRRLAERHSATSPAVHRVPSARTSNDASAPVSRIIIGLRNAEGRRHEHRLRYTTIHQDTGCRTCSLTLARGSSGVSTAGRRVGILLSASRKRGWGHRKRTRRCDGIDPGVASRPAGAALWPRRRSRRDRSRAEPFCSARCSASAQEARRPRWDHRSFRASLEGH